MASFSERLTALLNDPNNKKRIAQARAAATKPENRAKIQKLASRFTKRGGGSAGR